MLNIYTSALENLQHRLFCLEWGSIDNGLKYCAVFTKRQLVCSFVSVGQPEAGLQGCRYERTKGTHERVVGRLKNSHVESKVSLYRYGCLAHRLLHFRKCLFNFEQVLGTTSL